MQRQCVKITVVKGSVKMADKRNEIMEEQRRAREEFIKLKKMQQGEIKPEAKPSEMAVAPKTFKEKLQNYWYHFKFPTILAVFMIAVVAVLTVQCAQREKYDFSIMYFVYTPAMDSQLDKVEEYFEAKAKDLNGDGEVNVNVVNCSVNSESVDVNYRNTIFTKIQATIVAEHTTVLFIVDEDAKKYFDGVFKQDLFIEEPLKLGKEFCKATATDGVELPEDLMLGLRVIDGTTFDKNEQAKMAFTEGKRIIEQMKKQNS